MTTNISTLLEFIVPNKTPHYLAHLISKIESHAYNWEEILFQANLNLCTPLWYIELKKDDLLKYLPDELVQYLSHIYQLNLQRNEQFQSGLKEILDVFGKHEIDSILLKGAATFCDDLFEPGTRVMGDLDILVPIDKVSLCQSLIASLGYEPDPTDDDFNQNVIPSDIRQHHIARHIKKGTPLVVEIHFGISGGQAGRVFELADVWAQSIPVVYRESQSFILCPQHRILLNTVHAMLPLREYISGHISALQWVEFVLLVERYHLSFEWKQWFSIAEKNGFKHMFKLYLYIAVHYLQMHDGSNIKLNGNYLKLNANRLLLISKYQNTHIKLNVISKLISNIYKYGYYLGLIQWLWNNQCFTDQMTGNFERLRFCLSKLFSKDSRKAYWL